MFTLNMLLFKITCLNLGTLLPCFYNSQMWAKLATISDQTFAQLANKNSCDSTAAP